MSNGNRVNQNDVARRAGVSRSVVSYVLNNGPRNVAEATRQRVLDAIEELGYRPNQHAQRLKQGSDAATNSIGIITGGVGYNLMERPYYHIVLSGLYEHAYQQGQQISFLAYWDALRDPIFFNKHIHEQEISSIIFILPSLIPNDDENKKLLEKIVERIPYIICLEESILDLPTVKFDRADAARKATEHLIKLGHRRIACVSINDQRNTGYKLALLEHNIEYDETLIDFIIPSLTPTKSAYRIVTRLVEENADFSAIFAANDEAAIGTLAALHDHGLCVPKDIAVASIDNIDIAAMIRPALTTVDVPKQRLGQLAIQSLQTQKTFSNDSPVSMVIPTELIIRDSCGAKDGI